MKVFISWSGELSHRIAIIVRDWLPNVIQAVEPYVSSEDIDKGTRWFSDISSELDNTRFGIICLSRENIYAPWILFEAGALSKSIDKSRVVPLLIDISPSELKGPLVQFQASSFLENDMRKTLCSINKILEEKHLSEVQIAKSFNKWWPDLKANYEKILEEFSQTRSEQSLRSERDIIEEILELTRTFTRNISTEAYFRNLIESWRPTETDRAKESKRLHEIEDIRAFLKEHPNLKNIPELKELYNKHFLLQDEFLKLRKDLIDRL